MTDAKRLNELHYHWTIRDTYSHLAMMQEWTDQELKELGLNDQEITEFRIVEADFHASLKRLEAEKSQKHES